MWRLAIVVALASGCLRSNGSFHCASRSDCEANGVPGTCEAVGYCSFADGTCPTGARFGGLSGPYAGQCVAGHDAGIVDTVDAVPPPDSPPGAPGFVAEAHAEVGAVSSITYSLTIPAGVTDRYLLVLVAIPSDCVATSVTETVTGVTFDGVALAQVKSLLGTACPAVSTRSEHWGLVDPHEGTHDVVVQLSGNAQYTIHSGALAFGGVNQTTPVRATAALGGSGILSSIDVLSMPNDLVVNTVGHGGGIATSGETIRFLQNIDSSNSLNNSAASTQVATGTTTTMGWTFVDVDEWQTISTTLRP